ncbi:hypothetical protein PUV47_14065 [Pseudovibrio exalbescens]|uniref:capsular polysaccharide export protein, LipB/KpsS family n=1 Tax=Pseudovibrio exalbescens TaxID=197461 RepID=UPI002366B588|nr:hypothetical protein [Pseudovibrio exalbescens]MDD7911051.1 hypothetical protein [Pseudovibrio exalbescens]
MAKVAVIGSGVWAYRHEISQITGLDPVYLRRTQKPPAGVVAVAGWGNKPAVNDPRLYAKNNGLRYLAIEDGFLRSIYPGPTSPSASLFYDDLGIYYDTQQATRLDKLIASRVDAHGDTLGAQVIETLKSLGLSKYNSFERDLHPASILSFNTENAVLCVDQTFGDMSISGAQASEGRFAEMLAYVLEAYPSRPVIVKTHPDVMSGRKKGCIPDKLLRDTRVQLLQESVNPWLLFDVATEVHCVSSQLGFEALMAGASVHCWGAPFYAGRGLTHDHISMPERLACSLTDMVAAVYWDYAFYFDAWSRTKIDFFRAADQMNYLRQHMPRQVPRFQQIMPRELNFFLHKLLVLPNKPLVTRSVRSAER